MALENLERPRGASFFCLLAFQSEDTFFEVKSITEKRFSEVLYESNNLPKYTPDPFEREIAFPSRFSKVLSYKQRIHREELVQKKKEAVEIQIQLQKKDPSLLIVPGYVTSHNIVLAKSKDDFHRIYLYQGVYGEIVYKFIEGRLVPTEEAPPFFREREVLYFFSTLRESYELNKFKS
ncbi:MAG: DUF4416 family protein [Leptospira sp.]|nr:DUF4416 family protein [Leptospira sp.]